MLHTPVLKNEVLEYLQVQPNKTYLDATIGYGGHSQAMLDKSQGVHIVGVDRDQDALDFCKKLFKKKNVQLVHAAYSETEEIVEQSEVNKFDGILLDLGYSSPQMDTSGRGFSLQKDEPLDMRFDLSSNLVPAAEILNTYPSERLKSIFETYGEERFAHRIAQEIIKFRESQLFKTTGQLRDLVESVIPRRFWPKKIHPATRVFQALRIEVNQELEHLKVALPKLIEMLKPGGRVAVISFHSLEDRIVKQMFKNLSRNCICPKEFPVCKCNNQAKIKVITKKIITATKTEIKNNVRARSAKLRVAQAL